MGARLDAATLLERALIGDADRLGVAACVTAARSTRWASATFIGARHRMTIEGPHCAAVVAWLAGLAEADLPLRGHLVADLAVIEQAHADGRFTATIEALTVEEA
jgi:hypothetical protein